MAKRKQTGAEIQLKARRTSLGKKSNEELIDIILRKDKTERKLNSKINDLTEAIDNAVCENAEFSNRITNLLKSEQELNDLVKTKQEYINNLLASNNALEEKIEILARKINSVRNISRFRKHVAFACFGVITILILLLFYLH